MAYQLPTNNFGIQPNTQPQQYPTRQYSISKWGQSTTPGQYAWDGSTAFNMNGQSNTQPHSAPASSQTQFQMRANPTASSTYTPAPSAAQFQMQANPAASSQYTPAAPMSAGAQASAAVGGPATSHYTPPAGYNGAATPAPSPTPDNSQFQQGFNPQGLNTQYGTLDNLQPYMNPFLDQIISKGNNAIQNSAAARGLLGSSGTLNNIGDWTTSAQQGAYQDARNAFNGDRQYMTNNYWDNRTANTNDLNNANTWNYGLFKDQLNNYQGNLNDYYTQNNAINSQGQQGANNSGTIYGNLGDALAQLYGDMGNVQAQGSQAQGNNNNNFLSALTSLLPLLLAGG